MAWADRHGSGIYQEAEEAAIGDQSPKEFTGLHRSTKVPILKVSQDIPWHWNVGIAMAAVRCSGLPMLAVVARKSTAIVANVLLLPSRSISWMTIQESVANNRPNMTQCNAQTIDSCIPQEETLIQCDAHRN